MAHATTSQKHRTLHDNLVDIEEAKRIERLTLAVSSHAPSAVAKYLEQAAPAVGIVVAGFESAVPHVIKAFNMVHAWYSKLPKRLAMSLWGFCICFFGGRYAVSIAAYEAFKTTGGKQMLNYIAELRQEYKQLRDANTKDDMEVLDGDGIADVDEMDANALAMRKFKVFMKTIDPERMDRALSGLWQGYMGVLVALRFQFAKTVALANSIADSIRPVAGKILLPALLHVTPGEYRLDQNRFEVVMQDIRDDDSLENPENHLLSAIWDKGWHDYFAESVHVLGGKAVPLRRIRRYNGG